MIRVVVLPKASNPYQRLLYEPLKHRLTAVYGKTSRWQFCSYPSLLLQERLGGTRLVHLHWLYWLTVPLPWQHLRQITSAINVYVFLFLCRLLGMKLIWTVHNILPHETQTANDQAIAKRLSRQAVRKIVHTNYTVKQMKAKGLNVNNVAVIPHGNYIDSYTNTVSRTDARRKFGIGTSETVILFFGLIRPYKGIEDLIKSFKSLSAHNKNLRLVIAGSCSDSRLKASLQASINGYNVDFYEGFVADEAVQYYFKAADIVCLPFKAVTTSGSILLALSFGKPVVAPLAGALTDLPQDIGYFYNAKPKDGLTKTLQLVVSQTDKLSALGETGRKYAQTLNWETIANSTYQVYKEVLAHA